MKKGNFLRILTAALAAAILFSGCTLFRANNQKEDSSAVPAASFSSSSRVSETSSSEKAQSSSSEASSQPTRSQPTSSQNGPVLTITTDSEDFNAKFKKNPIDKAYISASNKAVSSVDMVNVSNQYAALWEKEISSAWGKLQKAMAADSGTKPKTYTAEQKKWEAGKDAALKKISDSARAAGGSMAQVDEASQIMDFYRSRAAQLYRELYGYDKNYTYAYSSK